MWSSNDDGAKLFFSFRVFPLLLFNGMFGVHGKGGMSGDDAADGLLLVVC